MVDYINNIYSNQVCESCGKKLTKNIKIICDSCHKSWENYLEQLEDIHGSTPDTEKSF